LGTLNGNQQQQRQQRNRGCRTDRRRLLLLFRGRVGVPRDGVRGQGAFDGVGSLLRQVEAVRVDHIGGLGQLAAAPQIARAQVHLHELLQRGRREIEFCCCLRCARAGAERGNPIVDLLLDGGHAREPEVLTLTDGDVRLLRRTQIGDRHGSATRVIGEGSSDRAIVCGGA